MVDCLLALPDLTMEEQYCFIVNSSVPCERVISKWCCAWSKLPTPHSRKKIVVTICRSPTSIEETHSEYVGSNDSLPCMKIPIPKPAHREISWRPNTRSFNSNWSSKPALMTLLSVFLLDCSVAFDAFDIQILLTHMKRVVWVQSNAPKWFQSFVQEGAVMENCPCRTGLLTCRVTPHILPLFLLKYLHATNQWIDLMISATDTQIYLLFPSHIYRESTELGQD